jgi:alanyl-tRNA synthetase
MKAEEIRKRFCDFFGKYHHEKVASSPLIPINDPTLLFANAGMNQFKDFFTGKAKPKNKRAVSIQKVVRAGGKHNDLENVGFTARHHTFFEMLGNFSFGDYFKKEAITFAWDFLLKELKIDASKLYVTIHESDDEAFDLWNKHIGLSAQRIFRKGDKDNFWEMGDTGPCGPCTEIFYDHGEKFSDPKFDPKTAKDLLEDEGRYVEIWNLVFMQYEKRKEGNEIKRFSLPNPSVDTGMGLERVTAVMQNVYWNYDTDLFSGIIKEIENISGKKYQDAQFTSSMRVVSDHARSAVMLITDGAIPSNEGRGYVLRRIIRRAIRHLRELGIKEVSFYKLVPNVLASLGGEYPQNKAGSSLAEKLLKLEETKFLETLDKGLRFLEEELSRIKNNLLPGQVAFKLYDTYGFPLDLTQVILKERKIDIDESGFLSAMEEQKTKSKASWKGSQGGVDNKFFHQLKERFGETEFLGYTKLKNQAKLLHVEKIGSQSIAIFNQTSFYGESGGQVGDQGKILLDGRAITNITDTQKPVENFWVHYIEDGDLLEVGHSYELAVDEKLRHLIKRNHSATHLLQSALIQVLGDHVKQAGSTVNDQKLRFDFTHHEAMTKDEIGQVEDLVNKKIQESLSVKPKIMAKAEALKEGVMALFGEKYGDEVRVLEMGTFSKEFCGGTHVDNTLEIGLFSIILETSLSSGVRRLEAVTSQEAVNRLQQRSLILKSVETLLNSNAQNVQTRTQQILQESKDQAKLIKQLQDKIQSIEGQKLFDNLEQLANGISFKFAVAPTGSDLRSLSDVFINKYPHGVILLVTETGAKLSVLLRVNSQNKNINCSQILKSGLQLINGTGGGRPDLAQGSGDVGKNAEEILLKHVKKNLGG